MNWYLSMSFKLNQGQTLFVQKLTLFTNIPLGLKCQAVPNALVYYSKVSTKNVYEIELRRSFAEKELMGIEKYCCHSNMLFRRKTLWTTMRLCEQRSLRYSPLRVYYQLCLHKLPQISNVGQSQTLQSTTPVHRNKKYLLV